MGGTANRKLSEKYGLKVYLCPGHHLYGPEAVHSNAAVAELLHKEAQKSFIRAYPDLDFRAIFGKNYLSDYELNELAYLTNTRFKTYVNRYCKSREMTTRDVLEHKIVTEVRLQYKGRSNDDRNVHTEQRIKSESSNQIQWE